MIFAIDTGASDWYTGGPEGEPLRLTCAAAMEREEGAVSAIWGAGRAGVKPTAAPRVGRRGKVNDKGKLSGDNASHLIPPYFDQRRGWSPPRFSIPVSLDSVDRDLAASAQRAARAARRIRRAAERDTTAQRENASDPRVELAVASVEK